MTDSNTQPNTDDAELTIEPDGFAWAESDDVPVVDEATRDRIWARIVEAIRE